MRKERGKGPSTETERRRGGTTNWKGWGNVKYMEGSLLPWALPREMTTKGGRKKKGGGEQKREKAGTRKRKELLKG